MRVISGKKRGAKLECPKGDNVRPTTDRIKESLFNIIKNRISDSIVLDIFSGSGALGIESLSRGAQRSYFIDNSKDSINYLKKNLTKTGFLECSNILEGDALLQIKKLESMNIRFDLVFIDPPYAKGLIEPVLSQLLKSKLLNQNSMVIVEHASEDHIKDSIDSLVKFDERIYGKTTKISFYKLED